MPRVNKPTNKELLQHIHEYSLNLNSRELYIHSHSVAEEESGLDFHVAVKTIKNLQLLDHISNEPIVIHLSSIGGNWNDGMAIYDAIKLTRSPVTIIGYGIVASMGTIIMQAGDIRSLTPNVEFMVHYGSFSIDTNSVSAKSAIDWNEKLNKKMLNIYCDRCKRGDFFKDKTDNYIIKYMDKKLRNQQEWYMDSEEAVKYGFIDIVWGTRGYE